MNPLKLALTAVSTVLFLIDEAWKALNPGTATVVDGVGPWIDLDDVTAAL